MALVDVEELEHEELVRSLALLMVWEIIEIEEEGLFLEGGEVSWERVAVNIDEYHRMSDRCFKMHFRMTRAVFEVIHSYDGERPFNSQTSPPERERTSFNDIMLMVIWLLATPDSFRSVALRFGVVPSTLYYFYIYIVEALRELAPRYISWPKEEERIVIKETFQRATGFPGVIGCIDCTHVYITAPVHDAQQYVNRNHKYSINVQAVVDHNLLVLQLHVGEAGSVNDARVFRKSNLHCDLLRRPLGEIRRLSSLDGSDADPHGFRVPHGRARKRADALLVWSEITAFLPINNSKTCQPTYFWKEKGTRMNILQ
ncbi:Putative nuclease [Frankliniella fusca]|uniref:Nuclease n=1 Tax=Frankliniella fusca TaxID=407009 RepID=A0AAE1HPZ8_9NEOP|nr:Putative nuclease [Frankliniella fusca]